METRVDQNDTVRLIDVNASERVVAEELEVQNGFLDAFCAEQAGGFCLVRLHKRDRFAERPFVGASDFAIIYQHLTAPPPDPRARVPALPEGLARLVLRMLAKAPTERPSAQEVASALARLLGVPSSAALPLLLAEAAPTEPAAAPREPGKPTERRTVLAAVALLSLGGGLLAAVLLLRRTAPLPPRAAPPAEPVQPPAPPPVPPPPPTHTPPKAEPPLRQKRGNRRSSTKNR